MPLADAQHHPERVLTQPAVGDEIPVLSMQITREQIDAYAEASGDRNPIHLDDEFARRVGLPGVIAHGLLDMGLLTRAVVEWAGDASRVKAIRCRFAGMVRPGDTLVCHGRVTKVDESSIELDVWAENQDGERVLSKGRAEVAARAL